MASPPIYETLVVRQGSTFNRRWLINDPVTGAAVDLTGWSARGHIRIHLTDVDPVFEFIGSGITVDANGYVTVLVTPEQSSTWDWRDGVYDIELVDPTGRVVRIAQGAVRVSAEVTR